MELSRKEYPAMLETLQPSQAVNVLNDRMRHVNKLNTDIADWLQERRKVEELYVQGLRKLANRHPPDDSSDLGIFSTPWQKIVSSAEALAESHHQLAVKIEADVERPLREFASTNREVQAMSTISGNLSAMSKEIESSRRKAEKLSGKGGKASAEKVASATQEVENATSQWDSQAPYVFEKLQAVDESRLNHLRDVLTQFQTHEVDQVERNRVSAEETLNVLLNVETADEIKTFALKFQSGQPRTSASTRKSSTANTPSRSLAPPPTPPRIRTDDESSQKSGSVQEQKHSGLHGLKRLGTVLSRRKSSHPYGRAISPDRQSSSNLAATLGSFGKSKSKEGNASNDRPVSPARRRSLTTRASDTSGSPKQTRQLSADKTNGTLPESSEEPVPSSNAINGAPASIPELHEPLQPTITPNNLPEPEKDAEGFSVRPSGLDAISQAEQEASLTSENREPQFKLDIRNAPIQEEDGDVETAMANMANTLRAQAAPQKRSGTLRGRRDVRNTIFVPNPQAPELTSIGETSTISTIPPPSSAPLSQPPIPASPPPPAQTQTPQSPVLKSLQRHNLLSDDHTISDTQSVRSGRSLSSSASATIRHPDLHEPGLNTSLVETVSAWFEHGHVTKSMVIGQVALAFNPIDISAGPFGTDSIRLENFPVLEKVAPNPAFIEQVPDSPGNYTVDLSKITKTSVAFHYQVHLESTNLASFAPIILSPAWKSEPTQTSVLLNYSLNPSFALGSHTSVTLKNLVIVLRLESGVKTTTCQSKPVGTFAREKSLIYWRLGDVTFSRDQPAQQIRARFLTDGEAKPGNAEARWEISGDQAVGLGSGLSVSRMVQGEGKSEAVEADPFADAEEGENAAAAASAAATVSWTEVQGVKKISSGTYLGV